MLKNVRHVERFSLRYKSEKSTTEEAHSYSRQVERFHCKMCGKTFTDIKCLAINLTVKNVQIYIYIYTTVLERHIRVHSKGKLKF